VIRPYLLLEANGYSIEQLDNRNDPYVDKLRERFLFARRMI